LVFGPNTYPIAGNQSTLNIALWVGFEPTSTELTPFRATKQRTIQNVLYGAKAYANINENILNYIFLYQ
jgi:hypothetical protein